MFQAFFAPLSIWRVTLNVRAEMNIDYPAECTVFVVDFNHSGSGSTKVVQLAGRPDRRILTGARTHLKDYRFVNLTLHTITYPVELGVPPPHTHTHTQEFMLIGRCLKALVKKAVELFLLLFVASYLC
jgi:hypothetical protein